MAHGMGIFKYAEGHPSFYDSFNRGMLNPSTLYMNKLLKEYNGFEGLKELTDVGGGVGTSLSMIISKYPHIKGINFDLPHVIAEAPAVPGVTHVEGNMFERVPNAQAIFMKWIIHNWSDELCLKLLKNCYKALPSSGKVIVVETILPESPEADPIAKCGFQVDVLMLAVTQGGKERSEKQYEALAKSAGFASITVVCDAYDVSVIEFYKR